MDEINYQLVNEFDFRARSIKKSKYMYICRSDRKARVVWSTSQETKQLLLIDSLKNHLNAKGFINTDKFYKSSQGTPYFSNENGTYLMTDYIDYPESDFSDERNMKEIVKAVALIHKCAIGFELPEDFEYPQMEIIKKFENGINNLKKLKKYVYNQKKYSDFDIAFIKSFDNYYKDAQESLDILRNSKIDELIKKAKIERMFCHNNLKEENLLKGKDSIFILGFDRMSIDHYVFDLAALIDRYIRKHGDSVLSIKEIIDVYSSYNEIDPEILKILYALIRFPSKYIKICEGFYNKKRTWVPNSISEQFKSLIEKREHYLEYLDPINTDNV